MNLPLTSPALVFAVLFAVTLFAPILGSRLHIPGLIGLILGGLAVGPHGLGLIGRSGLVELVGGAGLLYLMFLAGLELDRSTLRDRKRETAVMSISTFALPLAFGIAVAVTFDYSPLAAVLLGSLWASHTLVVYPLVSRHNVQNSRAVAVTVAATLVTDSLALLVLVFVAEIHTAGVLTSGSVVTVVLSLATLTTATLVLIPRVLRRLLTGIGQDRTARVTLVLVAVYGCAGLSELLGIEPIIGAFLAGLGTSPFVPRGGIVAERLGLLGTSFLVPIFLISVGMLVDPGIVLDPHTLLLGASFAAAATAGKFLASIITGRVGRYSRSEVRAAFALSNSQAAATLAATIVGFEIGLFDTRTVNAVLIVIFITVLIASWVGERSIPRLRMRATPARDLGEVVVLPVAHPEHGTRLAKLAASLAAPARGMVVPLHIVLDTQAEPAEITARKLWMRNLEDVCLGEGIEAHGQVRLADAVARGVSRAARELGATAIVMGWSDATSKTVMRVPSLAEDVAAATPVPLLAVLLRPAAHTRLVVSLRRRDLELRPELADLATEVGVRLGSTMPRVLVSTDDSPALTDHIRRLGKCEVVLDTGPRVAGIAAHTGRGDLVVIPTDLNRGSLAAELASLSSALPEVSVAVLLPPLGHDAVTHDSVASETSAGDHAGQPAGDGALPGNEQVPAVAPPADADDRRP